MLKKNQALENPLSDVSHIIANLDAGFVHLIACAKDIEGDLRLTPRRSAQDMLLELAEIMDQREQEQEHTHQNPSNAPKN